MWLRLEVLVRREQGVVDRVAVVAGDEGRRPDRIDVLEIRVHGDVELALRCGAQREGEAECGGRSGGADSRASLGVLWMFHFFTPREGAGGMSCVFEVVLVPGSVSGRPSAMGARRPGGSPGRVLESTDLW